MAVASPGPLRRHGYAAVRQSILETARDIMRIDGVAALTLNEVARRMGMKTPSLYTYFASKHDLYDALFLEGMRTFRARLNELFATHAIQTGLIEAAIADYMAFADENPDLYALLFERPVPGFVPSEVSLAEAAALLDDAARQFRSAIQAGLIHSGLSVEATRDLFIAVSHGLTALKRANEPQSPRSVGRFGPLIPAAAALLSDAWLTGAPQSPRSLE